MPRQPRKVDPRRGFQVTHSADPTVGEGRVMTMRVLATTHPWGKRIVAISSDTIDIQ